MDTWSSSYNHPRSIGRLVGRSIARSLDRSITRSLGRAVARSLGRSVHSASFFKTKSSETLPMIQSNQIKVFWLLEVFNQIQKRAFSQNRCRPQGNTNKNGKSWFLRIDAARRATLEKLEIVHFQNQTRTSNCWTNTRPTNVVEHRTPEK